MCVCNIWLVAHWWWAAVSSEAGFFTSRRVRGEGGPPASGSSLRRGRSKTVKNGQKQCKKCSLKTHRLEFCPSPRRGTTQPRTFESSSEASLDTGGQPSHCHWTGLPIFFTSPTWPLVRTVLAFKNISPAACDCQPSVAAQHCTALQCGGPAPTRSRA